MCCKGVSYSLFIVYTIIYPSLSLSLLLSHSRFSLFPSQAEIVKRLSAICAQIIPFLSQEVSVTTARHTYTQTQSICKHFHIQETIIHAPGLYHIFYAFTIIKENRKNCMLSKLVINSKVLILLTKNSL